MLDSITQGLWAVLFIIFVLAFFFFVFVCWQIRAELKNLFGSLGRLILAFGVALRKSIKDEYTQEEIVRNIGFFELRGNTKTADYWKRELSRKYPEEANK